LVCAEEETVVITRTWRGWSRSDQADRYEQHYRSEVVATLQQVPGFRLAKVWRALRPGGWLNMPAISAAGEDLEAALSRLRNLLWGGGVRLPEQVAERARAVGFAGVQVVPALGGTFRAIVGQRPA